MNDRKDLCDAPDHVDSRGLALPKMSFSEALGVVHDLAVQNQIDENDIAFGDDGLSGQAEWQATASDVVQDLLTNRSGEIDALDSPVSVGNHSHEALTPDRSMDPTQPLNAVRICLAMAEEGALDPNGYDAEDMAEEVARQQRGLDMVRDLIVTHGERLDALMAMGATP